MIFEIKKTDIFEVVLIFYHIKNANLVHIKNAAHPTTIRVKLEEHDLFSSIEGRFRTDAQCLVSRFYPIRTGFHRRNLAIYICFAFDFMHEFILPSSVGAKYLGRERPSRSLQHWH